MRVETFCRKEKCVEYERTIPITVKHNFVTNCMYVYFLERMGTHAVTLSVLVTKGHRFS